MHPLVVCPPIIEVFKELATPGTNSCAVALVAVCSAVGITCQSKYPPGLSDLPSPFTTTIVGRSTFANRTIALMWTTAETGPDTGGVAINHFVPLLRRTQTPSATDDSDRCNTQSTTTDQPDVSAVCDVPPAARKRRRRRRHLLNNDQSNVT